MGDWISLRGLGFVLLLTSFGWKVSSMYFYMRSGKGHKEESIYPRRGAVSPLQCAYYCTRDETCNSISFNDKDGTCFLLTNTLLESTTEDNPGLNSTWTTVYRRGFPEEPNRFRLVCMDGWVEVGDRCYFIANDFTTFYNAQTGFFTTDHGRLDAVDRIVKGLGIVFMGEHVYQEFCQQEGGKLVEPKTNETFELLKTYLIVNDYGEHLNNYWIGLKGKDEPGAMVWLSNGAVPQYTNWAIGEPKYNSECTHLRSSNGYEWYTYICSGFSSYICE